MSRQMYKQAGNKDPTLTLWITVLTNLVVAARDMAECDPALEVCGPQQARQGT